MEDNLAAVRVLEHEAKVQDQAVVAAQRSLDLSTTRYRGGVTSYLEVITAQSAALTDEITAVDILGRRMVATVQLIQALGGAWDSSGLPQRPECCGKLESAKMETNHACAASSIARIEADRKWRDLSVSTDFEVRGGAKSIPGSEKPGRSARALGRRCPRDAHARKGLNQEKGCQSVRETQPN